MAELQYTITATVNGAEEIADFKADMAAIAENPNVVVDATGLQDAATASSDLATGLGDTATAAGEVEAPLESAGGFAQLFGDKFTIASIKALGVAGAMDILGQAIDLGRKAWEAYNAKQTVTDETTRAVSSALTDQAGALGGVLDALNEIAGTEAATPVERLTAAITEGIDPEELSKIVSALGTVNLQLTDLPTTLNAIEVGGDSAVDSLEQLALQSGIPPEFARNIAEAVIASEDMGGIQDSLILSMGGSNAAVEELTDTYGTQIGALEQLNDAQQNIDLEKIATEQLAVARGTDTATAALVAQAEVEVGPDASQLDVWSRYAELQATATARAEEQAAAAQFQAEQLADAAEGAEQFSDAMGSVDWAEADVRGATSAFSTFTDQLFAAGNEAQARESAFDAFFESVRGSELTLNAATEAGRAQQDALEGIARALDTDLVAAYDNANGSQEAFVTAATDIADDTLLRLQQGLGLTTDQVDLLAEQMGLTPEQIVTRFELAGNAEALEKLGLLQSAIVNLPDDVELIVNTQILAGDYTGALATVQTYFDDNPPTVEGRITFPGLQNAIRESIGGGPEGFTATVIAAIKPEVGVLPDETILVSVLLDDTEARSDFEAFYGDMTDFGAIVNHVALDTEQAGIDHTTFIVDSAGLSILNAVAVDTVDAAADMATFVDAERTATVDVELGTVPSLAEIRQAIGPIIVQAQVHVQASNISGRFGSRWT